MSIEEEIFEIINEGKLYQLDLDTLIEFRKKIRKGEVAEIKSQDSMAVHLSKAITELEKAKASTNCSLCKSEIEIMKKYIYERMKSLYKKDMLIKIALKRGYKSWDDIPENEKEEIRREAEKNDRRGDYI